MGSRAASFSGSVPTGLCIGCEAETANHRTRYGGGCWPSTKCSAATLIRTCLAKAIEECWAPRDAARGHAASPAQAALPRQAPVVRAVALLRNEKQTARLAE